MAINLLMSVIVNIKMPEVSVIIPVYNCEKFISETIKSVLKQTYEDFEIIVIDDGSRDKTAEIIKTFNDLRIVYIEQNNKGVSAARNNAIAKANGKYIAFLDHDDLWLSEKLEKQIPLFENKKVGLVFCNAIYFNEKGDNWNLYGIKKPSREFMFQELLRNYRLCMSTAVIRKTALDRLSEYFDSRFHIGEEMDLFLRIAYKNEVAYLDEPLVKYRIHEQNLSILRKEIIPKEEDMIINKLCNLYPEIRIKYKDEINTKMNEIQFRYAYVEWEKGNKQKTREILKPYVLQGNKKFIIFYLKTFLPDIVYSILKFIGSFKLVRYVYFRFYAKHIGEYHSKVKRLKG